MQLSQIAMNKCFCLVVLSVLRQSRSRQGAGLYPCSWPLANLEADTLCQKYSYPLAQDTVTLTVVDGFVGRCCRVVSRLLAAMFGSRALPDYDATFLRG